MFWVINIILRKERKKFHCIIICLCQTMSIDQSQILFNNLSSVTKHTIINCFLGTVTNNEEKIKISLNSNKNPNQKKTETK